MKLQTLGTVLLLAASYAMYMECWGAAITMLILFVLLALVPPDFNDTTKKG